MKKITDVVFAFILLILLLPMLLLILLFVFIQTGENPIFVQKRGLNINGRIFNLFKIRTLYSKKCKKNISCEDVFIKTDFSNAIILGGRFLRKTGLDELPQLINILLGEMSFIGPRPLSLHDLNLLKNTNHQLYRRREDNNSLPGISGYWQIFGNREAGLKNLIELDEYYNTNKSFSMDMFLIVFTIPVVLFGRHSDAIANSKTKNSFHLHAPSVDGQPISLISHSWLGR